MKRSILNIELRTEQDVVLTRQRAKHIAAIIGFDLQDQTRIATATSEIARNAFRYAGGGRVEFFLDEVSEPMLGLCISDTGPGIRELDQVLDGCYQSQTGLGIGIIGARKLMDHFEITSRPGATSIVIGKTLPRSAAPVTPQLLQTITTELSRKPPINAMDEMQQQNQELLQAMSALRARQAEVERLNLELAETNRGVLALYAELDDKAQELRKVSDLKTRFLSNMTHELRTPLNSMIMLARLMLSERDGPLGAEYRKQANFISTSAETLLEMVNDLLDLAKIEAGKTDVRTSTFTMNSLLGNLRGMFRPIVVSREVELVVGLTLEDVVICSDEPKISQILRNLVSNALKFTETGEVIVTADTDSGFVHFNVKDTGPGIPPELQQRLFQDFTQLTDSYRKGIKGTGLGLSISRQLAELLGGRITLQSEVGVGSTFTVILPLVYSGPARHSISSAEEALRA